MPTKTKELAPPEMPLDHKVNHLLFQTVHNMKTPLATVEGICNLAKSKTDSNETLKYLSLIEQTIDQMRNLVYDLLEVSRTSEVELRPEVLDLNQLIANIISIIPKRSPAILYKIDLPPHTAFVCDRRLLNNCLQNLIQNASKYHSPGAQFPKVKIHGQQNESNFTFTISDNGIGIPIQAQKKLFTPFFRAHENYQGHGIGLFLTKKSIETLGGIITYSSQEGLGSSFSILIPKQKT